MTVIEAARLLTQGNEAEVASDDDPDLEDVDPDLEDDDLAVELSAVLDQGAEIAGTVDHAVEATEIADQEVGVATAHTDTQPVEVTMSGAAIDEVPVDHAMCATTVHSSLPWMASVLAPTAQAVIAAMPKHRPSNRPKRHQMLPTHHRTSLK